MKTLITLWKVNSSILLLCFFLPFVAPMCSSEKPAKDESTIDSLSIESNRGSIFPDSVLQDTVSSQEKVMENPYTVYSKESQQQDRNLLNFIESPDGENLSGLGYIYNYWLLGATIVSIPVSFILILTSLFMRKWRAKTLLISISLLCLLFFGLINLSELAYGYWVALAFNFVLVILTAVISNKEKSALPR